MDPSNPLQTCPYEKTHRIVKSGMQRHLVKCRKNHRSKDMKICIYNSTHLIHPMEYEYHLEHCEDQREVVSFAYTTEENEGFKPIPVGHINSLFIPNKNEDWDLDADVPCYNPLDNIQDKPVLRMLQCASKSKKKQFRKEERARFQKIEAKASVQINPPEDSIEEETEILPQSYELDNNDTDYGFNNLSLSDLSNTATNLLAKKNESSVKDRSLVLNRPLTYAEKLKPQAYNADNNFPPMVKNENFGNARKIGKIANSIQEESNQPVKVMGRGKRLIESLLQNAELSKKPSAALSKNKK